MSEERQAQVVELDDYRPHQTGHAKCVKCSREWVAVVPLARAPYDLECPSCHEFAGVMEGDGDE